MNLQGFQSTIKQTVNIFAAYLVYIFILQLYRE